MHSVSQQEAAEANPVSRQEQTRFWRDARFRDMECLSASFITHEFSPHSHDTFSIGAIEVGCQVASIRGTREHTGPGALYLINPGEVHDGQPGAPEGYRYRMIYPEVSLLTDIIEDVTGRAFNGMPSFDRQLLSDPEVARAFNLAHSRMENGGVAELESEESMYCVLATMFARHGSDILRAPDHSEPRAMRRVRDYIAAHFDAEIGLEALAKAAGLSRAHMIRAFRKHYFITPHAFQTDMRIRHARHLLRMGATPSETAAACGFADQAHMTRQFKARTGLTPAVFRAG
ncbi:MULTISPECIES: AraC family transcriptional regulator [Rhizobiaceae]|uniref:AraC family transcriptional regulator n=1 Tax=Peteryoungia algae TaxID=2919917 RepID=A0ABT0D412_9HYPH|nr:MULTISPECIES: AraC family transcriptional regulator [unclassified Rhizobium]MCC8933715.1 AraC family transcriptional regulator [Rhizobium sp. 'Codium 1']MCJ8240144.1 AraC family transcriptional regulator [Rhizobium sp. SSM4.3]